VSEPLLRVSGLSKRFRRGDAAIDAVSAVSLDVRAGETLALVGPSGSGKSTLARLILRLIEPDAGSVHFDGVDFLALTGSALRSARAGLQMVFQDPHAAFNPRATVSRVLADPLRIHGVATRAERPAAIERLLESVDLPAAFAVRPLHDLSGGQRQRVAIARALAPGPKLVVLDEAVSALDVSTRRRTLALLADLQRSRGMSYLFVTHDLAAVRLIAHRVAVMDRGAIVETGTVRDVVENPQSATARALVAAQPRLPARSEMS
jgi:peptide/nickel transport system ATP-binding protein